MSQMTHQISQMGQDVSVTFVPHLLPMIRGIEVTVYVSTSLSLMRRGNFPVRLVRAPSFLGR